MFCQGNSLSRRNLLMVGAIGGLGLNLGDFFRLQASAAEDQAAQPHGKVKQPSAKSVIYIFLPGGIAHQETFDPKPHSPLEYRGALNSIATNVTGVRIGQLLPQLSKLADQFTICRSMTHGEAAHERGVHNMFTGYRPSPALQYPSMGSVVSHELGPRNNLPPYICIPNQPNEFAGSGYLSSSYAAFSLGDDPARKGFKVRDLSLPSDVSVDRFARRQKLLDVVNHHFDQTEKSDALDSVDTFYQRAYSLISSQAARDAFDISKEDPKTLARYGRNQAGARMLMARRLVEAGVRFVTLTYGSWDMHNNINQGMRRQLPRFDKGLAALLTDLKERGLLDSTLVCVGSEFGRTPKINQNGGRDHWPKVFSTLLAGGGIKQGAVYGSSDANAAEPEDDPVTVEDWATTIYHCMGIQARKELMAPGARPIEIVDGGKVVDGLLA